MKIFATFLALAIISMTSSANAQLSSEMRAEYNTLMKSENYKAAVKQIEAVQKAGDDSFETNRLLAGALLNRLDQVGLLKKRSIGKKMKKVLERGVKLQPESIYALGDLAQFHMQAPGIVGGDKDKAKALAERIMAINRIEGHVLKGKIALSENDIMMATTQLDKALKIEPKNTDLLAYKGFAQIYFKAYADAIVTLDKCLEIDASNTSCLYQVGKAAELGDVQHTKGIAAFEKLIAANAYSDNALAYVHYRFGNLYAQSGDKALAIEQYDKAIKINDLKEAKAAKKKLN